MARAEGGGWGGVREAPGGGLTSPSVPCSASESSVPPLGSLPSAGSAAIPGEEAPAPSTPAVLTHLHVLGGEAPERLQREVRLVALLPLHVLVVVGGALALQPQVTDKLLHLPGSKAGPRSGRGRAGSGGRASAPQAELPGP